MECIRPLSMFALRRFDMARTVQLRRALRLLLGHFLDWPSDFSSVASSEQSFRRFMNNVKYLQKQRTKSVSKQASGFVTRPKNQKNTLYAKHYHDTFPGKPGTACTRHSSWNECDSNGPPAELSQVKCFHLALSFAYAKLFQIFTSNHVIFSLSIQLGPLSLRRYSINLFAQSSSSFLCSWPNNLKLTNKQ